MKKYFLLTFGCQTNKNDSERIKRKIESLGYQSASEMNEADLVVVNTCSVRQSAADRVYGRIQRIRKIKKKNKNFKALLTGCVLTKDLQRLKEDFDYVLAIKTLPYWGEALKNERFYYYPHQRGEIFCEKYNLDYFKIKPNYNAPHSVYVPVSTGCDNFCTYCVVPFTRGPLLCRSEEDILKEVKEALGKGAKEIWLIGQNANSWKKEGKDFSDLLKKGNDLKGSFWLNFTSSYPKDFTKKLIKTIKNCKKVGRYVSLPVQSGDENILKRMNRGYTISFYKNLVKRIRKEMPGIVLSTDVIVGFPGETRKEFENTKKLFKDLRFDTAYVAEYSARPGTAASRLEDDVSPEGKERRRKELEEILKKISIEKNKSLKGETLEVLIHEKQEKAAIGKTKNYKTVKIKDEKGKIKKGEIIKAKITGATPWGLEGKIS